MHRLRLGNSTYVVYFKRTANSPAEGITLVRCSNQPFVSGRNLFQTTQQWESGAEVVHIRQETHDVNDFSTVSLQERKDTCSKVLRSWIREIAECNLAATMERTAEASPETLRCPD